MNLAASLYLFAIFACGVSALCTAAAAWKGVGTNVERPLAIFSCGAVLAAWAARFVEAGHLPLFGTYESALSLAVATTACGIAWSSRSVPRSGLAVGICLVSSAIMAHGFTFDPTPYALTISERSWVVDLHAIAAWSAFGALTANGVLAALCLLRGPVAAESLARPLAFSLSLGFLLHSAMMATGSLYKFLLFGRAWSFDPIETLGFAAWISYGTLVHLNLLGGWGGWRLAPWCLFVFAILLVSYRAIVYFPAWSTYHIFDMDLRIHLMGGE